jgi:glycogen(starch) synthase
MKILFVSNLYPPDYLGGYELLCETVVEEFVRRGHHAHVLTTAPEDPSILERDNRQRPYLVQRLLKLYLPFSRPAAILRAERRRAHCQNREATSRVIDQFHPDVIFLWSHLRLTLGSAEAAERSGIPCVYTFNDPHFTGYAPRPFSLAPRALAGYCLDRLVYPDITLSRLRFENTLCISECLKQEMIDGGVPIASCRVIYQGIPLERFPIKTGPGRVGNPIRLLYSGQLHEYKGVHTLLEAMAGLQTGAWSVTIAGAGPAEYENRLRQLAAALPWPVDFVGKVPYEKMPSIYREHDLFVFPSIWKEPFGLTHLEAMASGTPVISTDRGGHGEFLVHEDNCLIFKPGNSDALAAAILRLSNDQSLTERLALSARQCVEQRFTRARYMDDLEKELERVSAEGRA